MNQRYKKIYIKLLTGIQDSLKTVRKYLKPPSRTRSFWQLWEREKKELSEIKMSK